MKVVEESSLMEWPLGSSSIPSWVQEDSMSICSGERFPSRTIQVYVEEDAATEGEGRCPMRGPFSDGEVLRMEDKQRGSMPSCHSL